jgi:lipopolysaccharide/colanic/teichoic acid biosynthesis glycosyltransferase
MVKFSHRLAFSASVAVVFAVLSAIHNATLGDYPLFKQNPLLWAVLFVAVASSAAYVVDLPNRGRISRSAAGGLVAGAVAVVVVASLQALTTSQYLPRFVLFSTPIGLGLISVLWTLFLRGRLNSRNETLLLLTEGERSEIFLGDLARFGSDQFDEQRVVVGRAAFDQAAELSAGQDDSSSGVTWVVVDLDNPLAREICGRLVSNRSKRLRIRTLSGFYEEFFGKLWLEGLDDSNLVFDIAELHHQTYQRLSRLVDVTVGFVLLIALGAVSPFVIVGNALGNRGPIFYRQPRVGRGDVAFSILKFRTMGVSSAPTVWTTENDPRITPFGGLLRRLHIDELPQALNILRGDIAIVGPRPEQVGYVEVLAREIPFYGLRHVIRPGLTGWAQVNYKYGSTVEDARVKLSYDLHYIRNQNLLLDLKILVRTARNIFGMKGT